MEIVLNENLAIVFLVITIAVTFYFYGSKILRFVAWALIGLITIASALIAMALIIPAIIVYVVVILLLLLV